MERANQSAREADFTVSLRPAPLGVVVTDEESIPDDFKVPQPARVDKRRILEYLKHGESVTGATLTNQRNSLSVRTK